MRGFNIYFSPKGCDLVTIKLGNLYVPIALSIFAFSSLAQKMFTEDACFLSTNSNIKTYTSVSLYNKIKINEKVFEKSKRLKF